VTASGENLLNLLDKLSVEQSIRFVENEMSNAERLLLSVISTQ